MKGQKSRIRLAKRIKWYEELVKRVGVMYEKGYSKPGSNKK